MAQFARPDSLVTNESWQASSGSSFYDLIDEVTVSDSDYVQSFQFASDDLLEFGLSNVTDPSSSSGHTVRYRYQKHASGGATMSLVVQLKQGTTVIASSTDSNVANGWADGSFTLSGSEADSITDYDDLRIGFIANRESSGQARQVQVSWAELEVPDASSAVSGSATGTAVLTGVASGYDVEVGTASGTAVVTGVAVGIDIELGTASGTAVLVGSAVGTSDSGAVSGSASGTAVVTGVAVGIDIELGTASGTAVLVGSAVGTSDSGAVSGSASGTAVVTGVASGYDVELGTATGTARATGTAFGGGEIDIPGPYSLKVHLEILVTDATGKIIGNLQTRPDAVPWVMNEIEKTTFNMSRRDAFFKEEFLRFGNGLVIRFSNDLPDWGGIITLRDWQWGSCLIEAQSAEILAKFRKTARQRVFNSVGVGAIVEALVGEMDAIWPTGIALGEIWAGESAETITYESAFLDQVLNDMVDVRGMDSWCIAPVIENGFVTFTLNTYQSRGVTNLNLQLVDGANVSPPQFVEDGANIINSWELAGDGTGWGDADRIYATAQDDQSISDNRLREGFETRTDITTQDAMNAAAEAFVSVTAPPQRKFLLSAIDALPARFGSYGVGDRVGGWLPDYGFGGTNESLRVLGMAWVPGNVLDLLVEDS